MGFALCALFRSIPKSYDAHLGSALSISSVLVGLFAIYYLLPRQIMLCAFPFLILATAMNVGIICRILNTPVSQWLGERSYSIYLWHTPIMYVWFLPYMEKIDSQMPLSNLGVGIVNMAIIVLGTFLVAEISYRLFENPIRNLVAAHRLRVRMVGQP
jgi:peptidoglycan/LPS O-acetylase OafA/YrhL